MKSFLPFVLSLSAPISNAALAGAWETFSTEEKANEWLLYDYADDMFYAPNWFERDNPFIGASFEENATNPGVYNQGLWFIADNAVADGAFTGDFHRKGIRGIEIDVFFSDANELDFCDIVIASNSTGETIFYYSRNFPGSDFTGDPDWYFLNPLFSDPWFVHNQVTPQYDEVTLTPVILASITEIGIRIFPTLTNDTPWTPLIDNVALTPTVVAPVPETGSSNGDFQLSFNQLEGNEYTIQKSSLDSSGWADVAGQTSISGTTNYTFKTTLIPQGEFYRVLSAAAYYQVSEVN